jgi:hypothetical protein
MVPLFFCDIHHPMHRLRGAAYLNPSCLYPAALQYQLASGFIQRWSHGRLLIKGASDGADMVAGIRRGCAGVEGAGCRQLQIREVVRSSSWSGERTERQLGECGRPSLGPRNRLNQPSSSSKLVPARTPTFTRPLTSENQASCLSNTTTHCTAPETFTAATKKYPHCAPACQWSRTIPSHCVTSAAGLPLTEALQRGRRPVCTLSPYGTLVHDSNRYVIAAHTMSTNDPEPPSPTIAHDQNAPAPVKKAARNMTSPAKPSNWSSPMSALARKVANLPDGPVNALCGASAGVASGIVTCPLDVIKTRLQAQGSFRPRNYTGPTRAVYKGLTGTARVIWREDGVRGLYRGLGPMLLGYIPTWAVYMSTYESTKEFLNSRMGQYTRRQSGSVADRLCSQKISGSHAPSLRSPPADALR